MLGIKKTSLIDSSMTFNPDKFLNDEKVSNFLYWSLLFCIIFVGGGLSFAKYAMAQQQQNEYLQNHKCERVTEKVETLRGDNKYQLWKCNNGYFLTSSR